MQSPFAILPQWNAQDKAILPPHLADNPLFIAAARHSRLVRLMRRAIPLLCILGLVLLILRSFFTFFSATPDGLGMSSVAIDGQKIVMDKPRLSGFKRDGSSYEMTARDAIQDLRVPNILELNILQARIQNGEKGWTNLWADFGVYDNKAEKLNVRSNVRVRTDAGTEADLAEAVIEFKGGVVITEKPVEVRSNQGKINAHKMQILENGKHMVFEGNVQSIFVNATKDDIKQTPLRTGAQNEAGTHNEQ